MYRRFGMLFSLILTSIQRIINICWTSFRGKVTITFKNDDLYAWLIEAPFGVSPKIPMNDVADSHKQFGKALSITI